MKRVFLIVIDGLGVGAQPDAHLYGDVGMNTLGHVCEKTRCALPNLQAMGIGNILPLASVPEFSNPLAAYGKLQEVSQGKDSTTGHWELAGIQLSKAFPTYPKGFPQEVIQGFLKICGAESVLCNLPFSGTDVIDTYGEEHLKTGNPIVYTSADSVFQVATHTDIVSIETLFGWCKEARNSVLIGDHQVGRVIARPFRGEAGNFERLGDHRHDFSCDPPAHNLPQVLQDAGMATYSIGKVIDLFAEKGFTGFERTKSNAEGLKLLSESILARNADFVFVNLIDTDQLFGHRLDPEGFANSLKYIDEALPGILFSLSAGDVMILTGDHGNDPCSTSTDHSREYTPLLVYPAEAAIEANLGTRSTFSDVACSVAEYFGVMHSFPGKSFLRK